MKNGNVKRTNVLPGGFEGLKKRSKEMHIKVGILKGTGSYKNGAKVAEVAWWNEFGTKRIPARPFLRPTIHNNNVKYKKLIGKAILSILLGKANISKASSKIGLIAVSDLQSAITDLSEPENADSTKDLKGSSNPLIDTGRLRQSIHFEKVK